MGRSASNEIKNYFLPAPKVKVTGGADITGGASVFEAPKTGGWKEGTCVEIPAFKLLGADCEADDTADVVCGFSRPLNVKP